MTNPDKAKLVFVVDRSGSMFRIKYDMEQAIASFVSDQQKEPGECELAIYEFDTFHAEFFYSNGAPRSSFVYEPVFSGNLNDFTGYNLQPGGGTALHDAVSMAIDVEGEKLSKLTDADRPGTVVVIIVTDGYENSSIKYHASDVKRRIERQRDKYNWKFLFVGADQDAVLTAQEFGLSKNESLTYAANSYGTRSVIGTASAYTSSFRSGLEYEISDEEREQATQQ